MTTLDNNMGQSEDVAAYQMLVAVFVMEIDRQCGFAYLAAVDLQQASRALDHDGIWYSIQALLAAAANVSKLLWTRQKDNRGYPISRTLAQIYSVEVNSHPLLRDRTMRNHFEHFDERIGAWMKESTRHNFVDTNIGPVRQAIGGVEPKDFMRNFDPATGILHFRGQAYDLPALLKEIKHIQQERARFGIMGPWPDPTAG